MRSVIVENVTVVEASLAEDRGGRDIWEIRAEVPSLRSQYPIGPLRIPAGNTMIKKGQQSRVKLIRGNPKRGKENSDREFDYWWEVAPNGWDTTEEVGGVDDGAPSYYGMASAPSPGPGHDRDHQIAWNSAINNACHLLGASMGDWQIVDERSYALIDQMAWRIFNKIVNGPQNPPDDAVEAIETPAPAPAPTRPVRPAPRSSEAKLKQLDQARYNNVGAEVYAAMDVVTYISDHYEERSARDLSAAEIDVVIQAMLARKMLSSLTDEIDEIRI